MTSNYSNKIPANSATAIDTDPAHMKRRDFLKTTGALAAAVGMGRFGSARAGEKDTIRIGYISPVTGPFAPFAEADSHTLEVVKNAIGPGLTIGGKQYNVEIIVRDDQTSSDRASNLAAQLINRDKVDLILAQGALGVVNVAQQCELNGVPCITTMTPWQAWMIPLKGSPDKGFKYVHHFFWGIEDIGVVYLDIWKDLPTNKVVGTVWSNDVPGNAFGDAKSGLPAAFRQAGYRVVDVGRFQIGADDFSAHIQAFKKEGVEIITGLFNPPEWATFWKQSAQMGFRPKVATIAKALLFPAGAGALGNLVDGMSSEIWWSPAYPFKSSLTGQSAKQVAEAYERSTQKPWTQPIGVVHALWELGIHALKTSGNPKNPDAISAAIARTNTETVIGRIDWAGSPIKNVAKMRIVGGQWRVNRTQGRLELVITHNGTAREIPVQRKFEMLLAG